jgi:hypothetical protein
MKKELKYHYHFYNKAHRIKLKLVHKLIGLVSGQYKAMGINNGHVFTTIVTF